MQIQTKNKWFRIVTWYTGGTINGVKHYSKHYLIKVGMFNLRWWKEVDLS